MSLPIDPKSIPEHEVELAEFYANIFQISASIYEFGLVFGNESPLKVVPGEDRPGFIVGPKKMQVIKMSPQHAKAVAILMMERVARYEAEHGVNLPVPDFIARKVVYTPMARDEEE